MKKKKQLRNYALCNARRYAQSGDLIRMKGWIDRAVTFAPLTQMQEWRIKTIVGEKRFREVIS